MDPNEPISDVPPLFSAADLRALARQARRRARLLEIAADAQEAAERRHPFAGRLAEELPTLPFLDSLHGRSDKPSASSPSQQ